MEITYAHTIFFLILAAATCSAAEPQSFDASWITAIPEVLTYRSTGQQGDGLYQVSVWRTADGVELYINSQRRRSNGRQHAGGLP
jgi:hypothetical protein